MKIAGVNYPCFDCRHNTCTCRQRTEIQKQVFFAIGTGKVVSCEDYEEQRFHGLEGVRA